jgi:hypothetical protein
MATFTDIVRKQRAKGEGIGSSLATAFSERARERLDPRNYLFNRKGTLAALFPGLKGYQSKTGAEKLKGSGESGGLGAGSESILNTIADRLGELKSQFKMVAKNSIVLPQMARDTNLTKQNISKLVRAQGDTPAKKADAFFQRAGERESQYENAMKAGKPTAAKEVKKEDKDKSFLQKIFGFLAGPIGVLVSIFSSVIGTLTGGLKKLSEVIGSILSLASTAGLINTAKNVVKGVVGAGRGLAAAAAGTGALVANAAGKVFGGSKPSGGIAPKGKPLTDFGTAGQSREAVKNKSLWARFLAFVERKSPKLFARVFAKLSAAGGLAAIPGPGWILSAVELGLAAWTMYELYELWKEFNGLPSEQNTLSPEQKDSLTSTAPQQSTTPTTAPMSGREKGRNLEAQRKAQRAGVGAAADVNNSAQLNGATLKSPEELLSVIGKAESGGDYNKVNLGKAGGNKAKVIDGLTEMTVDQVLKKQDNKEFNAAGKYQFIPGTLRETMKMAGVKGTDKFDAATQEKLGRAKLDDTLKKAGNNPVAQQRALAKVWAAVAEPTTGKSFYDDGVNKASIQSAQLFTGGNLASAPSAPAAASTSSMSSLSTSTSTDMEYDPARIKAIASYRPRVPDKMTTDGKGAGITVNNVDNSKKSSSTGSGSSGVVATAYNDVLINLLLDRTVSDKMA